MRRNTVRILHVLNVLTIFYLLCALRIISAEFDILFSYRINKLIVVFRSLPIIVVNMKVWF